MKQPVTEPDSIMASAEWFAAWLPRTISPPSSAETVAAAPLPLPLVIDGVRTELKAVTEYLTDPSARGIEACLPHLERAVAAFGSCVKMKEMPLHELALADLRAQLALATTLFENAYALQSGWAAQLGLNLDGTPKQLLYSRQVWEA